MRQFAPFGRLALQRRPSAVSPNEARFASQLDLHDRAAVSFVLTWFRSRPRTERVFIAACVAIVVVQWIVIAHRRATHLGDYDVSREFGRRFLAHEDLYAGGLHYPYMPVAAMYFSPLALIDPHVGLALRYAMALGCLWLTMRLLHTMVREGSVAVASQELTIAAFSILLALQYIIRDLDDGGSHLILLAMLTGGIYRAWQGREHRAAAWFGLAMALKAPVALFVPFLLWKRRWRLAAWTVLGAACWIVLPAVWMGPSSWYRHQREWTHIVAGSLLGKRIAVAEESELRVQNQALRPVLMRYLQGGVSPAWANVLATLALLGLMGTCAWWARHRCRSVANSEWLLQCSVVLILTLLGSPVTWVQHMVFMLPALYLIVAEDRVIRRLGMPAVAAMAVYVTFALLLNREVLGRERSVLLLSYGAQTFCMLLVLAVVMLRRPTASLLRRRG